MPKNPPSHVRTIARCVAEMHASALLAALTAVWAGARTSPLLTCDEDSISKFVADDRSLCSFYQCASGQPVQFTCPNGSRVLSYFTKGPSDPCIVKVKNTNAACDRGNGTDDRIPGANKSNQCAQFRPCDARPGCACIDQVTGYYCSCPPSTTAATTTAHSPACDDLECNNGRCKNDSFSVYCECDSCYTGRTCEDKIDNCTLFCTSCFGGPDCGQVRTWLCDCYPCPSDEYICSRAPLYKVRDCNLGAASSGTRFTLMFEQNYYIGGEDQSALEIYITAGAPDGRSRAVSVSAPRAATGCSFLRNLVIPPGAIARVDVPVACRHDGTGLSNNGILVQEINNNSVTVYGINRAAFSADSIIAIPDRRAGVAFVVIAYPSFNNQNATDHQTQLGIVATEDNTQVNISLSTATDIPGSADSHTYIVRLNAFQTYQIQASQPGADLSGTIIVSSKSIHVVSGNMRTSVIINRSPAGVLSTDHLVEEIPPADTWGKTFAIVPIPRDVLGYSQTLELIRLVAYFDATCTLYNSTGQRAVSISTMNDWFIEFAVDASDNYFLDCSEPVLIMEITTSADERLPGLQNDPAMLYIPAVNQYTNYYVFAAPTYSQTGGPYGTTLAVLAAKSTIYQQIQVNNVLTSELPQFKQWQRIAPDLPISIENDRPPLFGGIFKIPNNVTSTIRHPIKQVVFMCLIYCYDNRESIGHAAGSALSSNNDVTMGIGLSQWEFVKYLNYTFIN